MKWLTASEICKELKISSTTLHNWKKAGRLSIKKLSASKFLYDLDHIMQNEIDQETTSNNDNIQNSLQEIYRHLKIIEKEMQLV
jgi:DNA-directed RNA polymerase specialized sigma subunit